MRSHRVSPEVFTALGRGEGDVSAAREIISAQRSKQLLNLHMIRERWAAHDPAAAETMDQLVRLSRASAAAAGAVESLVSYPAVMAWASAMLRQLQHQRSTGPRPDYLAGAVAAAALTSGNEAEVTVSIVGDEVVLPSLGAVRLSPIPRAERATVHCCRTGARILAPGHTPIEVTVGCDDSADWRGLRSIGVSANGLSLAVIVDDADHFAFPGLSDRRRRLDEGEWEIWQDTIAQAWSELATIHPVQAAEIAALVRVLVPVSRHRDRFTSATSPDAFGAIALSEQVSATALALALCHETQHLKLGALIDIVPLLADSGEPRWYAPWHDARRPLSALLQGAYAFLGVAGFWRRQRWHIDRPQEAMHAHTEFARWRDQVFEAVRTLRGSGALTAAGLHFTELMADTLSAWRHESVPAAAWRRASLESAEHRRAWTLRHGRTTP